MALGNGSMRVSSVKTEPVVRVSSLKAEPAARVSPLSEEHRRAFKKLTDSTRFRMFEGALWMEASVLQGPSTAAQRELARRISELVEAGRARPAA